MVRYLFYTIGDLTYQSPLVTDGFEQHFAIDVAYFFTCTVAKVSVAMPLKNRKR